MWRRLPETLSSRCSESSLFISRLESILLCLCLAIRSGLCHTVSSVKKPVGVDTNGTAQPVDLAQFAPAFVPVRGFEWIEGIRQWHQGFASSELFLVPRSGPKKHIPIKD